jgi:hypothetical protein
MASSTTGTDARLYTSAYSTPEHVELEPEPPVVQPRTVTGRRLPDSTLAEGYLVYRCGGCGRVGDLRAFPNHCLGCGGQREDIYYEIED